MQVKLWRHLDIPSTSLWHQTLALAFCMDVGLSLGTLLVLQELSQDRTLSF